MSASEAFLYAIENELRKNRITVFYKDSVHYNKLSGFSEHGKAAEMVVAWMLGNWCNSAKLKAELRWSDCSITLISPESDATIRIIVNGGGKREPDNQTARTEIPWCDTFDFGKAWFGTPCSDEYWDNICNYYDDPDRMSWADGLPKIITKELRRLVEENGTLSFTDTFEAILNKIGGIYMVVHSKTTKTIRYYEYGCLPTQITEVSEYGDIMGSWCSDPMFFEQDYLDEKLYLCATQKGYNITKQQYE